MKTAFWGLFFLVLASCSSSPTKQGEAQEAPSSGGKSYGVVVSGVLRDSKAGRSFFLMPREANESFTPKEERCADQISQALVLSGFQPAANQKKADLIVSVKFPKPARASDLTLTALLGGWRHSVEVEARNQNKKMAWSLEAYSESESEDIRSVFPYMAVALIDRFGKEPMAERVSVDENDPKVQKINGAAARN